MSKKRCGDCEYFVAFRNMNYETCTCDTITEYCELLQNEDTYDRDKGDEIWNNVFDDCPLKTGYVSTESSILLLQSKNEVHKQFDDYVRISCEKKKKLQDENEQLQTELNNYEKITNLLADYDVHHYNRWINQIKNYVEKTNEGFEYNREFIIKLCLSYTLQSLRNGEDLKRFQWGMINDN